MRIPARHSWLVVAGCLLLVPRATYAQQNCPRGHLPAYAHNDYENPRPLFGALLMGYRGVEADVFLVEGGLRLGHDRANARTGGSLEVVYLDPLDSLIRHCGRITRDGEPFLLTIELKEASQEAFDALRAALERHAIFGASYGSQRAMDIVLVGWHPAAQALAASGFSAAGIQHQLTRSSPRQADDDGSDLIRLVSLDYGKTIGRWWRVFDDKEQWWSALRNVKAARPDRLLRVHNVPVDVKIYRQLLQSGVDLIGTTNIEHSRTPLIDAMTGVRPY